VKEHEIINNVENSPVKTNIDEAVTYEKEEC
jgi:hypothetical protein